MSKNIRLLFLILLSHVLSSDILFAVQHLSDFSFTSASVLPVFTYCNTQYLIVAREAYGKSSRGTYDDFGGGREKNENHPLITAAREFFEEAIIPFTIGLTLTETQNYIDIGHTQNTQYIIGHSKNERKKSVTYIIQFNRYYKQLLNNFYTARNKITTKAYREKDRIAIVQWNVLKKAMSRIKNIKEARVYAREMDPKTGRWIKKRIKLRSCFIRKLRPFFLGASYEQGFDRKIRFYD